MNKKAMSSILGLCFIVLLAVTFIINIFTPDKGFSEEENRVLQEKPEFSLSNYMEGRYESKLETYVNDQFLLRNAFIKIKATADVTAGKLESNGVYRCKDNYLMEELTVPSDKLLENTLSSLKQFKRQYKKLDAFFLLAPNAGNILEEKLPNFTKLNDQDQSMDKFFKEIKRYGYTPIDVRDTLATHTDDTHIY